ncbi:hypothetical protein D7W79_05670 [Corallococcus exercitus]|uniref:Uncharacterized protein n=1 Tax=Corallococcus exercitus TaxID=2316736 RepID=A0A3A8ISQ3_9BACT|nr:hypothetical protein [Corallococcus exercitus]NOK35571.1 hypothetical protein [Corallococcus exercitus]RKG81331.1 hypothetical protein D7W79_05670 [Corallococcus exercitus]
MGKVAGAVGVVFMLGTSIVGLLGASVSNGIEAGVLGMVGLALYGGSSLFNGKAAEPTGVAKQA